MAHAHDKTYIASLGFADRDKKDPLHDLGCQYVVESARGPLGKILAPNYKFHGFRYEFPIEKGQNQFKTTIGFVDTILSFGKDVTDSSSIWLVEVKIEPVSLGDLLRQIQFYNGYLNVVDFGGQPQWVVAAAFEMSSAFVECLRQHKIVPVHLGENFQKWVAAQRALPKATNVPSI